MQGKRYIRDLIVLFILGVHLVVPAVDSIACEDCVGSVPFTGGFVISHLKAPHADVISTVSGNQGERGNASSQEEAQSICSICVNVAARDVYNHFGPFWAESASSVSHSYLLPLEPFSSINKPPQNRLV